MTSHELLQRLRRQGGDIRLGPEGQLQTRKCPKDLKRAISRSKPKLIAWLREQRASREWEASSRNPEWWRNYPYSTEPFGPTCSCRLCAYPHIHNDSGPAVNSDLEGEDIFDVLQQLANARTKLGHEGG
jgi:hypothetical protein